MAVAQNSAFAPDFAAAHIAAQRVIKLLDLVPKVDVYSDKGFKPVSS